MAKQAFFLCTALRVQQICCDVQEKRPNHVNTVAKKIGSLMTARVSLGGWSKFSTLMVSPLKNGELFVQFWTCGFNPRLFSNHEMSHSSWGKQLFSFHRLTMFVGFLFSHVFKSVSQETSVCRQTWREAKRFWDNILNLDWFGYVYSIIFTYLHLGYTYFLYFDVSI